MLITLAFKKGGPELLGLSIRYINMSGKCPWAVSSLLTALQYRTAYRGKTYLWDKEDLKDIVCYIRAIMQHH